MTRAGASVARAGAPTTASAVNSAGTTAFRLVGPRSAFGSAGRGRPVIARTRSTATPGHCRISSSGASWVTVRVGMPSPYATRSPDAWNMDDLVALEYDAHNCQVAIAVLPMTDITDPALAA